jgi:serine/threonine-protein kinase HipA
MAEQLAVWLYGDKVATIAEERHRLRLEYTTETREKFPGGTPLLSLKLPLTSERYPNNLVRAFLDGLLPEDESRRAIAEDLSLRADDTFGLVGALGRDCAGAIVIQPESDPTPPQPTIQTAEPLSNDELDELVANLRSAPLGVSPRVRISLAGVQEKLLLTRLANGVWGRPVDGTPSTHILKPEIRNYPNTVQNEAYCMRLAKHLGLQVADVETTEVGGRKLIVVSRYDRHVDLAGTVERIHQEDLCQATGTPPKKKYQDDGGPSLRQIAGILQAYDPDSLPRLLRAVTLNVIVGNGDAHAKNYSLLHARSGAIKLAPLYDVMSTLIYGDDRLAMHIDDVRRTNRVTAERLLNEAKSWGLSLQASTQSVYELLDSVDEASAIAASELEGVPEKLREIVKTQTETLRSDLAGRASV